MKDPLSTEQIDEGFAFFAWLRGMIYWQKVWPYYDGCGVCNALCLRDWRTGKRGRR